MSEHNSKVLKVYEQCETVLKLKRKFLEEIRVPSLPALQNSKQFSGIKDYCTVHYIQIAVANFFKEAEESYSQYSQKLSSKKAIEQEIKVNITKIKNTKDLTSKHEQLQHELDELKKHWEKEEPLVYYEINERAKFKNSFKEKFSQFKEAQTGLKTIKNPHFVHKLINHLKQNLEQISLQDKKYDIESEQNTQRITRQLKDLTKQMEINIENIKYRSFVFEQKKKLFSKFVDIPNPPHNSPKESKVGNKVRNYFEELILVSKDIKYHFKRLLLFTENLIQYFKQAEYILKQQSGILQKRYQNFIDQVLKNKEIRVILRIDIQERINNNLKTILGISQILKGISELLQNYKVFLIQCFNEASSYHERYTARELKFKQSTDSFEKMLIQHKGYFSSLQKKQEKYNQMNIQNLRKFIRGIYEMMKHVYQENVKSSRNRFQIPVHDMINRIFAQYNFAQQKSELSDSQSTAADNRDLNLQAKIKDFEKFIDSIELFDFATINWTNSYYACSLGPKLLIHGYLQVLQEGIYYESSFNKKNYFFGKTRIYIPKNDIYEVNKQKALLVFPDVLQIKANKGEIYFHALGKRDQIYQELISVYFPEVQETQTANGGEPEMEFNQFKGQSTTEMTAYKLSPYAIDFGEAVIKNCDLRVIFRRYFSDDSFTYQGKQYQNFKCYQLQHVGGLNASSNELTPPPPYYFMKKGEPLFSETVSDHSIRLSTFEKKIPIIPFISKGGNALCEQKSTYYWGGPDFFVLDIENRMKGFKLTESMTIKLRLFYRQDKQKNQVRCSTSCEISFATEGALTNTIKNEALAETKIVIQKTIGAIQKNEKNRSVYKNKGNNIQQENEQRAEYKDEIQKLRDQNLKLKNKIRIIVGVFLFLYLLTVLWLVRNSGHYEQQGKITIGLEEYQNLKGRNQRQKGGLWPFW